MSNRKTKRKDLATARKKKAGFNPRHNARKETRQTMGELLVAIGVYEDKVTEIGTRIEVEREQIHQRAGEKKDKALSALNAAYAVFLALITDNKAKIDKLLVEADKLATETMDLTKDVDVKWDDIKLQVQMNHMSIGEFHGAVMLLVQEYVLVISAIFSMYENYSVALRNSDDAEAIAVPDFQSEFEALVAKEREYAEEVDEDEENTRESRAIDAHVAVLTKPETVEEV